MEFQKIIERGMAVRRLYEKKEKQLYGSQWSIEELTLGFVGDVGDLAKLILAENGRRDIADSRAKLEHEFADCLWSIIVLSKLQSVDLEKSYMDTMDTLEKHLLENQ